MERVAKGWAGGSGEQGLENWNGEHRKKRRGIPSQVGMGPQEEF